MDEPLKLKTLQFGLSPDRSRVTMYFWDEGDENCAAVQFDATDLRPVIAAMMEFKICLQVEETLNPDADASPTPSPTLPATETALLIAKTLGVVRWKSGGAVLRATTAQGVPVQLALSPALRTGLQESLAAELPDE